MGPHSHLTQLPGPGHTLWSIIWENDPPMLNLKPMPIIWVASLGILMEALLMSAELFGDSQACMPGIIMGKDLPMPIPITDTDMVCTDTELPPIPDMLPLIPMEAHKVLGKDLPMPI